MRGIKMSKCEFYVNEEERTVVCKIPNTTYMVTDFLQENCVWTDVDMFGLLGRDLYQKVKMPRFFIGKAVCAPDDEWNEEAGKLLAFARAKNKCYKSMFKRANLIIRSVNERLEETIDIFNAFGEKLENNRAVLEEKISQCIPEE